MRSGIPGLKQRAGGREKKVRHADFTGVVRERIHGNINVLAVHASVLQFQKIRHTVEGLLDALMIIRIVIDLCTELRQVQVINQLVIS